MAMENQGLAFYMDFLPKVKDSGTKALFEALVKMEKDHYDYLSEQYQNLSRGKEVEDIKEEYESPEIFVARMEQQDVSPEEPSLEELSTLRMAVLIEDNFMNFYQKAAADEEERSVKKLLSNLAQWEKSHKDALGARYKKLMEKSNLYNLGDMSRYLML
ncbi:ferritin family protein [Calorimonas adulescens]|uniref:Ferritin family protein n=2 Tax=Calorimonas adulescens TaxID=2606906 RepID=A0A5D8QCS9_9THEO|nr:ferritin family protein [Calorimonas adulescens]